MAIIIVMMVVMVVMIMMIMVMMMSGDNNFDGDVSDRAQDLTSDCLVHQSVNIKYYKT